MKIKTIGIAKKVIAAVAAQLVALVVNLIASGEFDRVEWAQLAGAALTALLGYAAAPNMIATVPDRGYDTEEPVRTS